MYMNVKCQCEINNKQLTCPKPLSHLKSHSLLWWTSCTHSRWASWSPFKSNSHWSATGPGSVACLGATCLTNSVGKASGFNLFLFFRPLCSASIESASKQSASNAQKTVFSSTPLVSCSLDLLLPFQPEFRVFGELAHANTITVSVRAPSSNTASRHEIAEFRLVSQCLVLQIAKHAFSLWHHVNAPPTKKVISIPWVRMQNNVHFAVAGFFINFASIFSGISTLDRPPWCNKIIFKFSHERLPLIKPGNQLLPHRYSAARHKAQGRNQDFRKGGGKVEKNRERSAQKIFGPEAMPTN